MSSGSAQIGLTDPATGDQGSTTLTVTDPGVLTTVALGTTARGPSVVDLSPPNNATNVSRVTPIVIRFSEPVNPGSLSAGGIQLLDADGEPLAAGLTGVLIVKYVPRLVRRRKLAPVPLPFAFSRSGTKTRLTVRNA